MNILERFKKIFMNSEMDESMKQQSPAGENPKTANSSQPMLTEKSIVDLMQRLLSTREDAYSCEEAYALLEEYVELVASNEEAALLMPLVKNHVDMCPDCTEHLNILLNILKAETDGQ